MLKSTMLLACMTSISMLVFSQFQVGHMTKTFNDPSRTGGFGSGGGPGRQIQTEIYYPAASAGDNVPVIAGEHPVIVFGHGFVMTWDAYTNIWQHYVSKGYILAFPRTEGGFSPSHNDFGLDLKLVGERMVAENSVAASLLFQKVKNAVVIMGHSMGGGATMIAGASNVNIRGIVGLAPAETNPSAITAASSITVPALVFSGGSDGVTPPAEHHTPIYNALNSTCKSFVSIVGGAHCYFANTNFNCDFGESTSSSGITISRTEQQNRTYSILDPWLDFILNDNCTAYSSYLTALAASPSTLATQSTCPSVLVPVINENAGVLSSSLSGVAYQWYLNGVAINGAISQVYTPAANGDYTVEVFFSFGCALSTPITISGLSLNSFEADVLTVYPNPSHGEIFIGNGNSGLLSIDIYDLTGKIVLQVETAHRVELNSLEKGTYFVQVNGRKHQIIHLPN